MPGTLRPLLGMMRVPTSLLAALAAASSLAMVAPGARPSQFGMLLAVLFLVSAGGFLINDYFDVEKDRIAHPERALPSGKLPRRVALQAALVAFGLALAAASPLGPAAWGLVALNVALLAAYSHLLRVNGVLGNLLTAYLGSSVALLGGIVGGRLEPLLPCMAFLFFVILAREIVFDIRDRAGDAAADLRTLPIEKGVGFAFRVVWGILGFLVFCLLGLWFLGSARATLLAGFALTLIPLAWGLHRCQTAGSARDYARFVTWTRLGFLMTILILWAGSAEAGVAAPPPIPYLPGLPAGAAAFAIAGVAVTFMSIASIMIGQFNRFSQRPFTRSDQRWRFYAVFGWLMLVLVIQSFAYAYYANRPTGFFPAVSEGGPAWFFLAQGFMVLPILWLELIFARNWPQLGFTRYYEENINEMRPGFIEDSLVARGLAGPEQSVDRHRVWPQRTFVFLKTWVFAYVFSPLMFSHLARDQRHPLLRHDRARWFQLAQDILVILTIGAYLSCLALGIFTTAGYSLPNGVAWVAIYVMTFFSIVSTILAGSCFLYLGPSDRPDRTIWFLLGFHVVAVLLDAYVPLQKSASYTRGWLELVGGFGPLVLLLFLAVLIRRFLQEITEARDFAANLLRAGISANLADRALHYFGNLLLPARGALALVRAEVGDPLSATRSPTEEIERRKVLLEQIDTGLGALSEADSVIQDLKSQSRKGGETWTSLATLLDTVEQRLHLASKELPGLAETVSRLFPTELQVKVNPQLFLDVLANMLDNSMSALRASRQKPCRLEIIADYDDKHPPFPLKISIFDSGPGISVSVQDRIYDPYFSTKGQGSGLGLFVAREFMQALGGRISHSTKTDKDSFTRFNLEFPSSHVRLG